MTDPRMTRNIPTGQTSPSMQSTVEVSMIQNQLSSRFILCNTTHSEFISFECEGLLPRAIANHRIQIFIMTSNASLVNDLERTPAEL